MKIRHWSLGVLLTIWCCSPLPADDKPQLVFPVIAAYGGVVHRPEAVDQPRAGAKVVFDVTVDAPAEEVNKGLDRVARLLNLYGASGRKPSDISITVVLHGNATRSVLSNESYEAHCGRESNPNLPLIRELLSHGVEVLVCGQALSYKGYLVEEVSKDVRIAESAMNVLIHRQMDGFAYLPIH